MVDTDINVSENTVAGVVSALTLAVAFTLMGLGFENFWVVFPIGFGAILPMTLKLFDSHNFENATRDEKQEVDSNEKDPIEELRERFASGEISEQEFERKVEKLVETEDSKASEEKDVRNSDEKSLEIDYN